MKHHNFVGVQVSKLQLASFLNNVRVFAHQQPANVSKEEAPDGVVRVSISLRIFVVNPVVTSPFKDIILWIQIKTEITHTADNTLYLHSNENCNYHNDKCVLV